MASIQAILNGEARAHLPELSPPVKTLVTATIFVLALAMAGALGQIIVHDIVPTFFSMESHEMTTSTPQWQGTPRDDAFRGNGSRGDLFADDSAPVPTQERKPLLENEQFVWTLRWTHIHLFGMNMIFILMGPITLLLGLSARTRTWLVALPFAGVLIDVAAMWLKNFVSSGFFWLHVPGGLMFTTIFAFVSIRALWEMWGRPAAAT